MAKKTDEREDVRAGSPATLVRLDDETIEKIVERLTPVLFVAARVASRDTIRTPMRDLRAIFKDIIDEARVAFSFYADEKESK